MRRVVVTIPDSSASTIAIPTQEQPFRLAALAGTITDAGGVVWLPVVRATILSGGALKLWEVVGPKIFATDWALSFNAQNIVVPAFQETLAQDPVTGAGTIDNPGYTISAAATSGGTSAFGQVGGFASAAAVRFSASINGQSQSLVMSSVSWSNLALPDLTVDPNTTIIVTSTSGSSAIAWSSMVAILEFEDDE